VVELKCFTIFFIYRRANMPAFETFIRTKVNTNFRPEPNLDCTPITVLPLGTVVQVFGTYENSTFYSAKTEDGLYGYVSAKTQYVEPVTPEWLTKAKAVILEGEKYLGVEYEFGSSRTNSTTFDCSDFTMWAYKCIGVALPWDSRKQAVYGDIVDLDSLRTSDLVFFDTNGDGIVNHVALYVNGDKLLHTYRVGIGVTYTTFEAGGYWRKKATHARRVIK
jgi:cell wall-associated NlpC family hydrolase